MNIKVFYVLYYVYSHLLITSPCPSALSTQQNKNQSVNQTCIEKNVIKKLKHCCRLENAVEPDHGNAYLSTSWVWMPASYW